MIPTVAECFRLFEQHGMLDNIRDHSVVVARIAALLTESVNRAGGNLSLHLAVAAALLHDIGKTACLGNDRDHAKLGREICIGQGYPEVADIVADHVRLLNNRLPEITESEVVFYADKRVNHDAIVSLEERQSYIVGKYGRNIPARVAVLRGNCLKWWQVEKYLFAKLDFHPERLAEVIEHNSSAFDLFRRMEREQAVSENRPVSDF